MREGPLAGHRFPLRKELVLGRVNVDVTIDDPLISRRHAVVHCSDAGIEIEDLGSLNGTWVNGDRVVSRRPLVPGDVIRLGETMAEVVGEQMGTARATSPQLPGSLHAPRGPSERTPRPVTNYGPSRRFLLTSSVRPDWARSCLPTR